MFLRRITLRARFLLTMSIVAFALLVLGAWGVLANRIGIQKIEALFDQAQHSAAAVAQLREAVGEMRRLQANALSTTNAVEAERLIDLWT